MTDPLAQLPRVWRSLELPGYRSHPEEVAPYTAFALEELPPIGRPLDEELHWLLSEPCVAESLGEVAPFDPVPERPATRQDLLELLGAPVVGLPKPFARFVEDVEPRRRIRSATACYLDLADFVVPVEGGGRLVHLLSDQQWVLHWLLYQRGDEEAVFVSPEPIGFSDDPRAFVPESGDAAVCAPSFSEFLYRFWIENEIWFKLSETDPRPLTDEQRRYVEHYRP